MHQPNRIDNEPIVPKEVDKPSDKHAPSSFLPVGFIHCIFSEQAADVYWPSEPREKTLPHNLKVSHTNVSFGNEFRKTGSSLVWFQFKRTL